MPFPNTLALISEKRRQYRIPGWIVLTPRHKPQDSLYNNLVFSIKYEGINLLFFKKLFDSVDEIIIEDMVRSEKMEKYINEDLSEKTTRLVHNVHNDILHRTSVFLLLKDSKASFNIEGETPSNSRATRWGKAIGKAGNRPLSNEELLRLQQIVIENDRFIKMGFRKEGGIVGEHDRNTGEPIPEHVSAKWQDLDILLDGLVKTDSLLEKSEFHPVLTAAVIAFGFVFIHPFVDGNGRIHRYIMHHILAKRKFTPQGIIFPVSAAILDQIDDYRKILESYSHPLLGFMCIKYGYQSI